ncbi:MAG: molybdopterin cofactor-binding domain-containing protein [Acidobacteriota bacterium]
MRLKINGLWKQFVAETDWVLIDLLRDTLHLTGTKQSCDRKGQCDACTVIVNGEAVRSCLTKVETLEGAEILTIEGLGTPDRPHLIQEAFALTGAVQCGFCTPGMIMSTKGLLDTNSDPTIEEIKHALDRNQCRCTGYTKIIDAVRLAGRFIRGEVTPDEIRPDPEGPKYGVSHPAPSAMIKACGVAPFTADIYLKDCVEIAVVRSPEHHALIKSIDPSAALQQPGVIGVMTAQDIQGTNLYPDIISDQPLLCHDRVRCLGDPVAIVAAETRDQAEAAAAEVKVEYDPLPVIKSPDEGMEDGAQQIHPERPNLCFSQPQIKGDPDRALAESKYLVEAEFKTQLNHQAPLEPEASVAYFEGEDEDAQLVIVGRSINIHLHLAALQAALGWEDMRYEEAFSGGQFGIHAHITSEGLAGAAAIHFKRPIRYVPSLTESMVMTSKRHSFAMKVKLGADAAGKLTVYSNDFVVDNGAYTLLGTIVILRALRMLSGSYNIPNIRALGRLVYTNNPAGGAARGAGPPQVNYALESAMDMMAEKVGMDPLEFRLMNSLQPGETKSTGSLVEQWPFPELCDAIKPHYERALKEAAEFQDGPVKRGVGLGTGSFGIGQANDVARVAVEMDPDDGITIYGAVADPGEGNESMLTQLASHLLEIPLDKVRTVTRDTDRTTATGPAASSRMTYMPGGALVNAVEQLKQAMAEAGTTTYEGLKAADKPLRYMGIKKVLEEGQLDPETGQGPGYESQVHAIQLAEVAVNRKTGQAEIIKMTTAVDAGPVIHPQNLEGQLEGGMDMGAGYALREEYIHGQSRDYATFKFPTMKTSFDMEVIIRETPRVRGTLGSTGVGEMTMVPTAPAVINAINDACGVRITHLPATPPKIKQALAGEK